MLRGDGRYVDYGRQADNNQGQSMLTAGDGFQILLESLLHPYVDTQKHSQVNEDPLVGLLGETTMSSSTPFLDKSWARVLLE